MRPAGVAAMVLLAGSMRTAAAQELHNEVWIGQSGATNIIRILQDGNGNSAGADSVDLLINQSGRWNTLELEQHGWGNRVGTALPASGEGPYGIDQIGDWNSIDIDQENNLAGVGNAVQSVWQASVPGGASVANELIVRQAESGDLSGARHMLDIVIQINGGGAPNTAQITQSGGGEGSGHSVGRVRQNGAGNLVRTSQQARSASIGNINQDGRANTLVARQSDGEGHVMAVHSQIGMANEASLRQSGARNYVERVYQNNEGIAISGNRLAVVLVGDDNGGDVFGGRGSFSPELENYGAAQAAFTQIGDDNDLSYTVNGGNLNLFGATQVGTGNGTLAVTRGDSNEFAAFQFGDDNNLRVAVTGDANVASIRQEGQRNGLSLFQSQDGNLANVSIIGDDNNNPHLGGFTGSVRVASAAPGLTPGMLLQADSGNEMTVAVLGNENLFAIAQSGGGNSASLDVLGAGNQALIIQSGDSNSASVHQYGDRNSLALH